MESRKNVLFQPGMLADSWPVFVLPPQLQEVSMNSDVGLPEGGLPTIAGLCVIGMVAQPVPPQVRPGPTQPNPEKFLLCLKCGGLFP